MVSFPSPVWLALGVVGVSAVLAFLYLAATLVRNEVVLHDLKREVITLRVRYIRYLRGEPLDGPDADTGTEDGAEEAASASTPMSGDPPARQAA